MKNITYVYAGNRKNKYLTDSYESKDFFYGLFSFDKNKYNVEIIEMEDHNSLISNFLSFIDKIFQRFLAFLFIFQNSQLLKILIY